MITEIKPDWQAESKRHMRFNVCTVFGTTERNGQEYTDINTDVFPTPELKDRWALLIAAAPDLLEALKEIAKLEGPYKQDPLAHAESILESIQDIALAAIAKAEGRNA